FDLAGTRFGIATCYDIRFPEQFTALARRGAQAILVPLAWKEGPGKREQLQLLLRARALDSTTVVLAADQSPPPDHTGGAPRGIGRSAVVGPLGRVRQELGREPGLLLVDLDLEEIEAARASLPVPASSPGCSPCPPPGRRTTRCSAPIPRTARPSRPPPRRSPSPSPPTSSTSARWCGSATTTGRRSPRSSRPSTAPPPPPLWR